MKAKKAPWKDYKGTPIYEGDAIKHPSGETGVVVVIDGKSDEDRWRVDYDESANLSRLFLQLGKKGQAVVVSAGEVT